jgi:6-phospho-3-hexuloisomerase
MRSYAEIAALVLDEIGGALRSVSPDQLEQFRQMVLEADRIFIDAKGRSGLQIRGFAMRLMHLGLKVHVVDDVTTPNIAQGDVLVIASGSGRTATLVHHAAKARAAGAKIALITAAGESPIAQQSDCVVLIAAPTPKADDVRDGVSAQPMANLFEQALGLLLDITTIQLMDALGMTSEVMFGRHANLE